MNQFLNRSMPSAGSLIFLPFLLGALLLPPGGVNAQSPRIEVGEDLSEASDMKSCFLAAGAEDLDGFLVHFTNGTQKKLRKKTEMLFVQHEFVLEVLDCHVIDCSSKKGELAVRYRAGPFGRQVDVVAVLDMRCENGYWKIRHEQVKAVQSSTPTCSPSRSSYLGGVDLAMR